MARVMLENTRAFWAFFAALCFCVATSCFAVREDLSWTIAVGINVAVGLAGFLLWSGPLPEATTRPDPVVVDVPWAWAKYIHQTITSPARSRATPPASLPVELAPWLFLSDEKNARDFAKLKKLGITHVLSVLGLPPAQRKHVAAQYEAAGIHRLHISCDDREGYPMVARHWSECQQFLADARAAGGKVAVNCVAGINRSGVIATAAYMTVTRTPVIEAVRHCHARRGQLLWNFSFVQQLCSLARDEGLLGGKPEGFDDLAPPPPPGPPAAAKSFRSALDGL